MATEKRLIDANALKKRMLSYYGCVNEHTSKSTYTGETLMDYEVADMIEDCIDDAPTVDAVEVPCRCKDCKYWKHFAHVGCTDFAKVCTLANYMIGANGYCLYGERREGE